MSAQKMPLILVDGSSYLYRAFHALPPLVNSKGVPTGAVYGVISMLKKLLADYKPRYMAVVFDPKGKTFRDALYKDYKATRKSMPPELSQQIAPIFEIIKAMGLPLVMLDGYEADDVIGSLLPIAAAHDLNTLISTGDKDLAQLVTAKVHLINTMTNTLLDEAGVMAKFAVRPSQIVDYLTLIGDTADNIKGVAKVGPKTAAKWLQEYETLQNLTQNAAELPGKIGANFRDFIKEIPLTQSLVTIKRDIPLALTLDDLLIKEKDSVRLIAAYKALEFKSWLAELLQAPATVATESKIAYEIIMEEKAFARWLGLLENSKLIAFDTETTSLNYMEAEIVGLSFSLASHEACYIPLAHCYQDAPTQLDREMVLAALTPIFENAKIKKIAQNSKYDMEILANYQIKLAGIAYDTMLESYVLDSLSHNHDMNSLALKHLGWRTIAYTDVTGKGAKQIPFAAVAIDIAGKYAAEDADVTFRLHQTLWPRINEIAGLKRVFTTIEMPLVPVLAKIERTGVLIDPNKLIRQEIELTARLQELEKLAYALAQKTFNINSPKQLQEILYSDLKLPVLQKTPTGQASTADAVLQELALSYPLPKTIIEYRSLSKLMSTYTRRLVAQINPQTGRIHTSYNQALTATGRLSSSEPNLQNIPIRSPEGRKIRQAFIAPAGCILISADYSQIELRIMAHISGDPGLLHAFTHNQDIHAATAAEVFAVAIDEVTTDMRRHAKAINFGLIYGMSAFGLTKQLAISRKEAELYIARYFERYPKVKAYMDNTRLQAKASGFVETLWGRRLYLPDINAKQIPRQKAAERSAINAPLQGSAADIIKLAMLNIAAWLSASDLKTKMIMQVHDELVFEAPLAEVDAVIAGIQKYMCNVATLDVPLLVAIGKGDNWDEASNH